MSEIHVAHPKQHFIYANFYVQIQILIIHLRYNSSFRNYVFIHHDFKVLYNFFTSISLDLFMRT